MSPTKIEAWKDDAGAIHKTRRDAMEADARRALGLIGNGTIWRLRAETISDIMTHNKRILDILQKLNSEPESELNVDKGVP